MAMSAATGLVSTIRARIPAGADWYEDANLERRGGSFSSAADVYYIGAPISESAQGGSYAVLFNTGVLTGGEVRPTVAYVAVGDADTYSVPPPGPSDADEVRLERDEQWEDAIRHGEAWPNA